jgi:AraC-like DNA-binding protein
MHPEFDVMEYGSLGAPFLDKQFGISRDGFHAIAIEERQYIILFTNSFLFSQGLMTENSPAGTNWVKDFRSTDAVYREMLADCCRRLLEEYRGRGPDRLDLIRHYISILLLRIRQVCRRLLIDDAGEVPDQRFSLIARFKKSIREHLASAQVEDDARSVQYYAGLLFVHPNHLNAVVKKTTGMPAITHIHIQVIEEAKSLLRETDLPVKAISYRLAFREPAHFYTFFRKYTSLTPNGYRRHYQGRRCPACSGAG